MTYWTLGVSAMRHDASAALFRDNQFVAAVEEERLTNRKHIGGWPFHAIGYVLNEAGIQPSDVNLVIDNFQLSALLTNGAMDLARDTFDSRGEYFWKRLKSFSAVARNANRRQSAMHTQFPNARVTSAPHHLAHANYAVASSNWEPGAVLTIDSIGESDTTTLFDFDGEGFRKCFALRSTDSLGYIYSAVTDLLGRRRNDEEGTIMALASLGDPSIHRDLFQQLIEITPTGYRVNRELANPRGFTSSIPRLKPDTVNRLGGFREPGAVLGPTEADVAAALQERTEQTIVHLAQLAKQHSKREKLYVAGGVAMNCKSIGKIVSAGIFSSVHVPPSPGDAGTSIGAALHGLKDRFSPARDDSLTSAYLGPRYSNTSIDASLKELNLNSTVHQDDLVQVIVDKLLDGQIVGVFHGNGELGPRALGNRSILSAATDAQVVERLANDIKKREGFRPFAPAVLAEHAADYFSPAHMTPYMSIALQATEKARNEVPAVIHVDNSARVETVTPQANTILRKILEGYYRASGIPVLINTSLNVKGRPTAGRPQDAIDAFLAMDLDAIAIESHVISR